MSWAVLAYVILAEKLPSLNKLYYVFAVLGMEIFLVIMWLSAMGAVAAERAKYTYNVTIEDCYNDGSLISSSFCTVSKRDIEKRAVVLTKRGMNNMVAIACLCALEM
jgi:hypothetical protein